MGKKGLSTKNTKADKIWIRDFPKQTKAESNKRKQKPPPDQSSKKLKMAFLNGNNLDIREEINEIEYKKTTEKI